MIFLDKLSFYSYDYIQVCAELTTLLQNIQSFFLFSSFYIYTHYFSFWQSTRLFSDISVSCVVAHLFLYFGQDENLPEQVYEPRLFQTLCNQLTYFRCSLPFLSTIFSALTCIYIFIQRYLYAMPKQSFLSPFLQKAHIFGCYLVHFQLLLC